MNPKMRTALYGIVLAVLALAVAYGLLTGDTATLWAELADRVLAAVAMIVAIRNVPAAPDARRATDEAEG